MHFLLNRQKATFVAKVDKSAGVGKLRVGEQALNHCRHIGHGIVYVTLHKVQRYMEFLLMEVNRLEN